MPRTRPLAATAALALIGALAPVAVANAQTDPPPGGESALAEQITLLAGPFAGESFVSPLVEPPEISIESATIVVNYSGFSAQAQAAFQRAVDLWKQLIVSPQTIVVDAFFEPLGTNVLGSAGPNRIFMNSCGSMQADTWYPDALANVLCNTNLHSDTEGEVRISSNFSNWYYGIDGQPGAGQYDMVSVVMHELGHVLGFLGSMNVSGDNGRWGFTAGFPQNAPPMIYDRFAENGTNQPLVLNALFLNNSPQLKTQLTGNAVYFDGPNATAANGGTPTQLYAPPTWSAGSSFSHLNESTYNGTANALMTPILGSGEANHSPGAVTLGMFKDWGWTLPFAPGPPLNVVATGGSGGAIVTFNPPANDGGSAPTLYTATAQPGGSTSTGTSSPVGIAGLTNGTAYTVSVFATNAIGPGAASVPVNVVPNPALHGFHPIDPVRILDTRFGTDPMSCPTCQNIVGARGPLTDTQVDITQNLPLPNPVPPSADAVVMNVTATAATAAGWLTIWDTGSPPTASNLNFAAGQTVPNLVTVKLHTNGTVRLGNTIGCVCSGSTHVVFDVVGYYDEATSPTVGDPIQSITPTRILDTRAGVPCATCTDPRKTALGPQETHDLDVVAPSGPVPGTATAVVMNVTAVVPSKDGWLTLFPTAPGPPTVPNASNLNFAAGQTVPNLVKVKRGVGGKVSIANTFGNPTAGNTHVVVDVVGYFDPGATGGGVTTLTPRRILDTRFGVVGANLRSTPLSPGESATIQVAGLGGVPSTGASTVVVNLTATAPTAAGWLTVYPSGPSPPTTSNLNFVAGQTVPNLVVVRLDPGTGTIRIANTFGNPAAGNTHVVVDVVGWYA